MVNVILFTNWFAAPITSSLLGFVLLGYILGVMSSWGIPYERTASTHAHAGLFRVLFPILIQPLSFSHAVAFAKVSGIPPQNIGMRFSVFSFLEQNLISIVYLILMILRQDAIFIFRVILLFEVPTATLLAAVIKAIFMAREVFFSQRQCASAGFTAALRDIQFSILTYAQLTVGVAGRRCECRFSPRRAILPRENFTTNGVFWG